MKTDWKTYFFLMIMTLHDPKLGVFFGLYSFYMAFEGIMEYRRNKKERREKLEALEQTAPPDEP